MQHFTSLLRWEPFCISRRTISELPAVLPLRASFAWFQIEDVVAAVLHPRTELIEKGPKMETLAIMAEV